MAELLVAARRTFLPVRCQTARPSGARRCYRPRVLLASTEVTTSGWVLYCFVGVAFVATMAVALVAVVRNGKQLRRLGGPDPALTAALDGKAQIVSSEWLGRVVNLEYVYRVVLRVEVAGRAPLRSHRGTGLRSYAGGGAAAWQHRRGPHRGRRSSVRQDRLTRQYSGIHRPKYQKPKPPNTGLKTGTTA
jgi:hypothetical protein